jgi:hypothetical protein
MWTYTAYILEKFCERKKDDCEEIEFKELNNFIFQILWRKNNLVFHDGINDLLDDLEYLKKINVITFEENKDPDKIILKINDRNILLKISKIVDESAKLTGINLFNEYKERIDRAVKIDLVVPS